MARHALLSLALLSAWCTTPSAPAPPSASPRADHNDPNAVNSIFSDVAASAADLYDMFGWPSDDHAHGERLVVALTFASVPVAGTLDPDLLYKIKLDPDPRLPNALGADPSWENVQAYLAASAKKYLELQAAEIRVRADGHGNALVDFLGFPEGNFSKQVPCNAVTSIATPGGKTLQIFVGGRDDAFFNDLPGFFRSINYAPQFYHVAEASNALRELPIPKTLLELEGNTLFNFDASRPLHGSGEKLELPATLPAWPPTGGVRFRKDEHGNFRFVYSGKDAQAGKNVNAVVLELPLDFVTREPARDRIVNAWGESWVLKAANKVESIPDDMPGIGFLARHSGALAILALAVGVLLPLSRWRVAAIARGSRSLHWLFVLAGLAALVVGGGLLFFSRSVERGNDFFLRAEAERDEFMRRYKLVDTDGVPFADAGLCEREDGRQLGANNIALGLRFLERFAHLGWGFGPSISALGLKCSFDHDDSPVSRYEEYSSPLEAFPRVKKALFQPLNMPDDSWNPRRLDIALRRPFEIFVPNVNAIDMDTSGTWPFGRRPEDQVATRFLSVFLDMTAEVGGRRVDVDTLSDQRVWDAAPIEPKTPPNPLHNDKPFLDHFPYLAEPW